MKKSLLLKTVYTVSSAGLFVLMFILSRNNYVLFHSFIEMFAIVTACGVFMIAFHSRAYVQNQFFILIGISFLFVACLDFLHLLAYKGMGVFPGNDPDLPTQLWIASRYLHAISFLAAPVFLSVTVKIRNLFFIYTTVTICLILSIFLWEVFPACFITGSGLTPFKIVSEFVISVILLIAIISVSGNKERFDKSVFSLFIASMLTTIASEMAFTLYTDVYGFSNFIGHILKLIAYGLIYKAVIHTGLKRPYDLLFRELKQNEEELLKALSEIKTLHGILPICANCKKIRNDEGYWQKVEEYISEHTDAKFSHGICQSCAEKLYPDVFKK